MKRKGYLYPQIIAFENLYRAAYNTLRGKRNRSAAINFYYHLETELLALSDELQSEQYQPKPYQYFIIHEPKTRDICAAQLRDRVVHHAICQVIEPILEQRQIYDSYACRKGKGSHRAIQRGQYFSQQYHYYLKCDIRHCFASVSHAILKQMLLRCFKDRSLLNLLNTIIDYPYPHQVAKYGLPLGNLTSQHFTNLYLSELDHYVKETLNIKGYCRYMDDFLVFEKDKEKLHQYKATIEQFLHTRLDFQLKTKATLIAPVSEGIGFLGMQIFPHFIRLSPKSLKRIRRRMKINQQALQADKLDQQAYIQSLSSSVAHLQQANTWHLRKSLFSTTMEL